MSTEVPPRAASAPRPLLTIVTISRNDPAGLARTLASARGLRASGDVEHVVIDGGDVAPATASEDGARILRQATRGIPAAFNEGLREARGEWVWFLNGGDAVHGSLDPALLLALLRGTTAGAIIFDYEREDGQPTARPPLHAVWPPVFPWIPHPGVFARRATLEAAGGFDESLAIAADYELWLRLFGGACPVDLVAIRVAWFAAGGMSSEFGRCAPEMARALWRSRRMLAKRAAAQTLVIPWGMALFGARSVAPY